MPDHPEKKLETPKDEESHGKDSASPLQSPHNRFVLGCFSSPRKAKGLLDAQLPASLKKVLLLDLLTVENSHFVDERMAEVESDLLFRIPRADRDGEAVYVYVLWEHQRKRDSLMALRIWIYLGMIYRLIVNEGRLLPGFKLPFVYPIVLFQGTEGWKKGLVLEDLIDLEGLDLELHRWVPRFEIDLIRLDEDTPRVRPSDQLAGLGLSLMQAVMYGKSPDWLANHFAELNQILGEDRSFVLLILHYALTAGDGLTKEEFLSIVNQKGDSNMKYEAGSVAEQLVAEGEARGKAEGEAEAKKKVALRLIKKGMADEDISEATDLPLNTIAELRMTGV